MSGDHTSTIPEEIRDSWRTPTQFYLHLNREFNFELDVAASRDNHLAPLYYDKEYDALQEGCWPSVTIWCNPPYSDIGPWVGKANQAALNGATVVMLIPSDTGVKWFQMVWQTATEIRFITGRLSFINPVTGAPTPGGKKPSMVVIWKPEPRFLDPIVKLINRDGMR